jgi:hypothetical protein
MSDREVMVAARDVIAERGYNWHIGVDAGSGPVCPALAVAIALGHAEYMSTLNHPAARKLARQFAPGCQSEDLSSACLRAQIGGGLSTADVLVFFDDAIEAEDRAAVDWESLEEAERVA